MNSTVWNLQTEERRLMANHRSPKPELQVRFLPLLPTSVRDGGRKLMLSEAGYRQAERSTNPAGVG